MDVEQLPPKQPNFLLVVALAAAALLALFLLAYLFIHFDRRHLGLRHHLAHPTSQLLPPAPATPASPA